MIKYYCIWSNYSLQKSGESFHFYFDRDNKRTPAKFNYKK